jgi:hypothetical protein
MLQLVAPVQETFTEALEFTSEFTARAWPNLIKHFNPAWVEEALAATGTATIRRRRLPADRTVWLVLGMAVMRDLPTPRSRVSSTLHCQPRTAAGQSPGAP